MIIRPLFAIVLCVLAGCSGGTGKSVKAESGLGTLIREATLDRLAKPAAPKANSAVTLSREQLAGITDPLIRTRTEKTGQKSLLYISQRNGASQIWFSPDKASVMMRAGLILRTNGLGTDLYSVDAPAMLGVLERRGPVGTAQRVHRTMDGANAVSSEVFECLIADQGLESLVVLGRSYSTRHYTESCTGKSASFANDYWLDQGGVLRASRQWIDKSYGSLFMERLID